MQTKLKFILRREGSAEINIAPLLDMVFILLIFFVITTNFTRQTGLDVQKPKAQSAFYQGPKTILVGISAEGTIHIHGRQVSLERLMQILAQEIKKRPDAAAVIIADRGAYVGRAVEVMDACLLAGIHKVSVAADKK
jgi:biopolymer transport protein ExbD